MFFEVCGDRLDSVSASSLSEASPDSTTARLPLREFITSTAHSEHQTEFNMKEQFENNSFLNENVSLTKSHSMFNVHSIIQFRITDIKEQYQEGYYGHYGSIILVAFSIEF